MTKIILLFATFMMSGACFAEPSVKADLKELYKIRREALPESMSQQERWAQLDAIRDRARPIVTKEFAKLADGEVAPLAHDLLKDPEAMEFCWSVLFTLFPTYSVDAQTRGVNAIFTTTPEPQRGNVVLSFVLKLPKEAFSAEEIQKWLVDTINGGMPAGAFYFILTDESAKAVSQTAKSSMRRFSQSRKRKDDNLFSLVSAVFLARRGDADALKLLNSLLDHRNIDSLLDTEYVIHAAAMSGNEKLMQKIRDVVVTDKRAHWNGEDCMPRETSFAHVAASACSLAIEGFPSVMHWGEYDEETKKKVRDWLEKNPASKIKSDIRPFFNGTPFQRIITAMWRQFTNEQNSKKP